MMFSVTRTGKEKVLHYFGKGTDIDIGGTLYGTTHSGGVYGYGTVFISYRQGIAG